MTPEGHKSILIHVPEDRYQAFKAHCAKNETTIKGKTTEIVMDYMKQRRIWLRGRKKNGS